MSLLTQYDADATALRRSTRRFLILATLLTLTVVAAIFVRQGLLRQTVSYGFVTDSAQDDISGAYPGIHCPSLKGTTCTLLKQAGNLDNLFPLSGWYV